MSHYNPYTATISAAFTELTSDRAQQYYALRAQQDTQMVFDATLTAGIAIYEAAVLTYNFGAFVRAWLWATEQAAIECTAIVVSAPATISVAAPQTLEDEIIEGEIIEEPTVYLLTAETIAVCAPQAQINEAWILAAIKNESLKPWEAIAPLTHALIESIETDAAIEAKATKTKATAKKRTPKASAERSRSASAKTATPAPRKSPTRATVGGYSASID
jgi:hypothetical protein